MGAIHVLLVVDCPGREASWVKYTLLMGSTGRLSKGLMYRETDAPIAVVREAEKQRERERGIRTEGYGLRF